MEMETFHKIERAREGRWPEFVYDRLLACVD
jgi:hypothetical protein